MKNHPLFILAYLLKVLTGALPLLLPDEDEELELGAL